jgi:hypothetical protein
MPPHVLGPVRLNGGEVLSKLEAGDSLVLSLQTYDALHQIAASSPFLGAAETMPTLPTVAYVDGLCRSGQIQQAVRLAGLGVVLPVGDSLLRCALARLGGRGDASSGAICMMQMGSCEYVGGANSQLDRPTLSSLCQPLADLRWGLLLCCRCCHLCVGGLQLQP